MRKNNIANMITALLFCLAVISCTENEFIKYDTGEKDAVYFNATNVSDSIFYNFGFYEITSYDMTIPVYLMGLPRDYDREFSIQLTNERYANDPVVPATSSYYEVPSSIVLPANATETGIPIKLLRHEDLLDTRVSLTLNITATEDLAIRGHDEYTIVFDDQTPATPIWWTTYDMGSFTKFKGQLFFRYLREMEQEQKAIYDAIVGRWGEFLDIPPNRYGSSPTVVYRIAFNKYVKLKMYNYSEAHPELELNIQKPTI